MRVHKYPLEPGISSVAPHVTRVQVPAPYVVLSVGEQDGQLVCWIAVPDDDVDGVQVEEVAFLVVGTGPSCFGHAPTRYVGTVQVRLSLSSVITEIVYHVFDVTP